MSVLKPNPSTFYRVKVQFTDKIHGGTPKDPEIIEKWLATRTKQGILTPEEAACIKAETLEEVEASTIDEGYAWSGFKSDADGLYIEARQIKAGIREAASSLGIIKKTRGVRQELQHLLFIEPDHVHLMKDGRPVKEPDGVEQGVVNAWAGMTKISAFKRNDYVERAEIEFTVRLVTVPSQKLTREDLEASLAHLEHLGLGANRSQGKGAFEVMAFDTMQSEE